MNKDWHKRTIKDCPRCGEKLYLNSTYGLECLSCGSDYNVWCPEKGCLGFLNTTGLWKAHSSNVTHTISLGKLSFLFE